MSEVDRLKIRLDEINEPTNFDLMKHMTPEELAEFLVESRYSFSGFLWHLERLIPKELIEAIKQEEIKEVENFLKKVAE